MCEREREKWIEERSANESNESESKSEKITDY